MNQEAALRSLLLRHLQYLKSFCSADRHKEVAESLTISSEADAYVATWRGNRTQQTFRFPKKDVILYQRGDHAASMGATGADEKNDHLGRSFAELALDLKQRDDRVTSPIQTTKNLTPVVGNLLLLGAMFAGSETVVAPVIGILAVIFVVDFYYKNTKFIFPIFPIFFTVIEAYSLATLVLGWMAVQTFLDSDSRYRRLRLTTYIVLTALILIFSILTEQKVGFNFTFYFYILIVILLIFFRNLIGIHSRIFPFLFPVACLGLVMDGHVNSGLIGGAGAIIGVAITFGLSHIERPDYFDRR